MRTKRAACLGMLSVSFTALLWGGPLLVLLLGGFAIARLYRRREVPAPPLSPEERQRLSAVLAEEEIPR